MAEVVSKRAKIIAGCSCSRTKDTIEMVQFAEKAGADSALALPPYYKQTSRQRIIDYYKKIAAAAGTGIVIDHYPLAAAVRMKPEMMAALAFNIMGILARVETGAWEWFPNWYPSESLYYIMHS